MGDIDCDCDCGDADCGCGDADCDCGDADCDCCSDLCAACCGCGNEDSCECCQNCCDPCGCSWYYFMVECFDAIADCLGDCCVCCESDKKKKKQEEEATPANINLMQDTYSLNSNPIVDQPRVEMKDMYYDLENESSGTDVHGISSDYQPMEAAAPLDPGPKPPAYV